MTKWIPQFITKGKDADVAKFDAVLSDDPVSAAPFRMEFAPGVIVIDAEIRDRSSLDVFVAALQAMGALLPVELPKPAEPMPEAKPADAIRTIDLTATEVPPVVEPLS